MGESGVTDSDFIPSLAKYFDDPEKGVLEDFNWFQPKELLLLDPTPCISDLANRRWYKQPSINEQFDAIRRIKSADICGPPPRSFRGFEPFAKLVAAYSGKIKQVANGHLPKRWRQRLPLRDRHTNNLLFEDLFAAGVAAMWASTLKFDLESGYQFWTGIRARVLGAISDEARIWRRHGSGENRIDRWLYSHPDATPEQLLTVPKRLGLKKSVFRSLEEAAEYLKQF